MKEQLQQSTELQQQLSLSPLQIQYARALEMTGPEFEEEVRRTLDDNPALEKVDDSTLLPLNDLGQTADTFNETAEQMQMADFRNDEDTPNWQLGGQASRGSSAPGFETFAEAQPETLFDHLRTQLSEIQLTAREKALGEYIIGDIDDNGYLTRTPIQMANDLTFDAGVDTTASEIEHLLKIIRRFDPPGVAAGNLRESLMIQLEALNNVDPTIRADAMSIASDHFETFARKHFDRLGSATGLGNQRAMRAVELLRSLNPKPGATFGRVDSSERLRQITPDFEIEPNDNGRVTMSMNNNIPQLRIETSFNIDDIDVRSKRRGADEALAFIKRKRDEAADFIRTARMRQETLWNVMSAIVKFQSDFFRSGDPADLRPMVLRDISAMTDYDLSVISRAASGKYVATPHGTYPLKFFFNEKPKENTDVSSHQILEALKKTIDSEDKRHPLSDDALAKILSEKGFDIARRTVTKYRERLSLPVARLRREL